MDAMDILGELLGGKSKKKSGGSLGGKILTEMFGGRRKSQPAPRPEPQRRSSGRGPDNRPQSIDRQAHELEDLLGVAQDRYSRRSERQTNSQNQPPRQPTQTRSREHEQSTSFDFSRRSPVGRRDPLTQNEEAMVLIRAMINAAKSDGRITPDEQQDILDRISNPSQDAIQFLRSEFSSPLDVRQFAWDVPLGMEHKVYTISLSAIELDTNKEATYLRDLAHGLRLSPELCNQLHQQYGAPCIY